MALPQNLPRNPAEITPEIPSQNLSESLQSFSNASPKNSLRDVIKNYCRECFRHFSINLFRNCSMDFFRASASFQAFLQKLLRLYRKPPRNILMNSYRYFFINSFRNFFTSLSSNSIGMSTRIFFSNTFKVPSSTSSTDSKKAFSKTSLADNAEEACK